MDGSSCSTAHDGPLSAKQRLPLLAIVLVVCVCTLGLGLLVADARADTDYALVPVSEKVGTRYRGWLVPGDSEQISTAVGGDGVSLNGLTMPEDGIHAGEFVQISASVREPDSNPVAGACVVFEWKCADGSTQRHATTTNERGIASMNRWVSQRESGQEATVFVSVDTPDWSVSRYASFVPK